VEFPLLENNDFEIKLLVNNYTFNEKEGEVPKTYTFLVVDDELYIRSAVKRVIISQIKTLTDSINLQIIEACDGVECILAVYLAKIKKVRIDAIISDETMAFITGSHSSKILEELISKGSLDHIKMYISTALSHTNIRNNFSKIVKKIYSKPLDKNVIQDILKDINK